MKKINNLLELWDYKCKMCSVPTQENSDTETNSTNLMDIINERVKLEGNLKKYDIKRIRSAEEFSTQILCKLFSDIQGLQLKFLQRIGLFCNIEEKNFKKLVVQAEHTVEKKEKYDISFWEGAAEDPKKLVCIVEVKIDAPFQTDQLVNYYNDLPAPKNEKGLATLTKYNVEEECQVGRVRNLAKDSGVKFKTLYWWDFIELLEEYKTQGDSIVNQALELFKSPYFLLQASGYSCYKKTFDTTFFMEKIEEFCENNKIRCRKREKLHAITLLAPNKNYKDSWYGNLSGLSIWLDGYAVKGGKKDKDNDKPRELKTKAFPFFDVVLRCYWQVENAAIEKSKIDKLKDCGYKECVVYDEKGNIRHQYFRKALSEQIRILDEKSLEKINNADSDFWKFLKKEISQWQEIVCGNKS